jgi:hypothetical protein
MLSMTPIEDAWGLGGRSIDKMSPYEQLKHSQNQHNAERIQASNDSVQAYNDEYEYDDYLIRVESFKPLRIDIAIQNEELIEFIEQQQKATELLLSYFNSNSSHPTDNSRVPIDVPAVKHENSSSTLPAADVEYFEAPTGNRSNDILMMLVLAVLVFILYEKLGGLSTQ